MGLNQGAPSAKQLTVDIVKKPEAVPSIVPILDIKKLPTTSNTASVASAGTEKDLGRPVMGSVHDW